MEVNQTTLDAAFPYGAVVVGDGKAIHLAGLETAQDANGTDWVRGWALPEKDFRYSLGDLRVEGEDWFFTHNKIPYRLSPLNEEDGKAISEAVEPY